MQSTNPETAPTNPSDDKQGYAAPCSYAYDVSDAQLSTLERLCQEAAHPCPQVRLSVLLHPYTSETLLEALLEAGVCALPDFLAGFTRLCKQRPLSPLPLERLANHPIPAVRQGLLGTHTLPQGVLEELASDPDPQVRAAVAQHPRAGVQVWILLAADSDVSVRNAVLHNPRSPEGLMALLGTRVVLEQH